MSSGRRLWRPITGCLAAYVLALYAILASFVPIPAASAALGAGALGFEICHHDGSDPARPADPQDSEHCKLCTANGQAPVAALPIPLPFIVAYTSKLRWRVIADDVAPLPASFGAQPRGPPLQA
jgi:Protein of unknown function (DUF2946)